MTSIRSAHAGSSGRLGRALWRNRCIYLMILPVVAYFLVFRYWPMSWLAVAFYDFKMLKGFSGSRFVGFENFIEFFGGMNFWRTIGNTVILNFYSLLFVFPAPVIFSLMLNEVARPGLKRTIQTISYLPYFISTVVLVGMIISFLSPSSGVLGAAIRWLGGEAPYLLGDPRYFRGINVVSGIWQTTGWNAVVYLSALTTIDPQLYEAAFMDGAGRMRRIWHISLPGIKNTVVILFVLRIGDLLGANMEKVLLLQNDLNLSISVSEETAIMRGEVTFYPKGFSFASYGRVLQAKSILRAYGNTIFTTVCGCVVSLLLTSLAAYPLAFAEFHGKKLYNLMIVITLWFSGGIVPSFLVMSSLGLTDTLWALIAANAVSAFNVLVLRSFFASMPYSLIESAKMDGANDFYSLFRIVLPLAKASLATIGLWVVVGHWKDYLGPLIYLRTYTKYTLQLVLRDMVMTAETSSLFEIMEGNRTAIPEQLKHAVIVVAMLPVLAVYPFVQKYFVKGVMLGAVKG